MEPECRPALLTGASEVEVMLAKQSQIDEPVAESLRAHGKDPKLFTGILQKAVGYLRGFVEFLRETKYCDRDPDGNPLIDHDMRIDITPEPLLAKPKGKDLLLKSRKQKLCGCSKS